MCGCFDIFDFVCFFTFFITAIVALLFVQYFFVYLDFETENKSAHLVRCMYFLILTFLGCLVFAGVQRRSICLLKWPSRLLVSLITLGLIALTTFLWTMDRLHKQGVRDLEVKTGKLSLVLVLALGYLFGVQKLINLIQPRNNHHQHPSNTNANLNYVFDLESQNQGMEFVPENFPNPPHSSSLVDSFRSQKLKSGHFQRREYFNADSNGVNYYKLLLEGSGTSNNASNQSNNIISASHSGNSKSFRKYSPKPSKVGSLTSLSVCSGEVGVISQV